MSIELCCECDQPTGNSGLLDDSIFIQYPDKEVGPLCQECRENHWVCEKCGEGVYAGWCGNPTVSEWWPLPEKGTGNLVS